MVRTTAIKSSGRVLSRQGAARASEEGLGPVAASLVTEDEHKKHGCGTQIVPSAQRAVVMDAAAACAAAAAAAVVSLCQLASGISGICQL